MPRRLASSHDRRRHRDHLPCGGEPLEPRLALAVGFAYGTWTITGDGDPARPDDTILVDRDPARSSLLRATVNGVVVGTIRESRVATIRVVGGAGDDTITIDVPGNRRIKTQLFGTITGSDGADTLFGGPGNDSLVGGRGNDILRGGAGDDSLAGGAGDDRLFGEAGTDTLRAGAGRNTLDGGDGRDAFFGTRDTDRVRLAAGERLIGSESTNPLRETTDPEWLKAWYIDTALSQWGDQLGREAGPWRWWTTAGDPVVATAPTAAPARLPDVSGTNNQVAGVDEGDLVKTDGSRLYVLAGDGVDVIDASSPDGLRVSGHVTTPGRERSLFLHGTRLTVVSQDDSWQPDTAAPGIIGMACWGGRWQSRVNVTVVDVSADGPATVVETTSLDGWLVDARAIDGRVIVVTQASLAIPTPGLIEIPPTTPVESPTVDPTPGGSTLGSAGSPGSSSGGPAADDAPPTGITLPIPAAAGPPDGPRFVYETAASYRARLEQAWATTALPRFDVTTISGRTAGGAVVDAGHVYLPVRASGGSLLSVVTFEVDDDTAGPESATTVAGISGSVSASTASLHVSAPQWGTWWDATDHDPTTNIYRFDLRSADVPLTAMGAVPGITLDQFSLDESADGLLRVATTSGFGDAAASGVYVLAAAAGTLQTVGSVTGLAPGERIYSVRFLGDRGYVSTFRQVDPLFVIDLSVPARPRVVGELKVPGFSSYLHPLDDTHLLGVGRDVDPGTGRIRGLQLSIFDVGDPARPRRTATYTFPGEGWESWSAALWDHHALSWFAAQRILALPVQQGDWWQGGTGLVVFRVETGSAAGFTELGEIRHDGPVQRSVRIGELLYSVSAGQVKVHRLDDPTVEIAGVNLSPPADTPWPVTVW